MARQIMIRLIIGLVTVIGLTALVGMAQASMLENNQTARGSQAGDPIACPCTQDIGIGDADALLATSTGGQSSDPRARGLNDPTNQNGSGGGN